MAKHDGLETQSASEMAQIKAKAVQVYEQYTTVMAEGEKLKEVDDNLRAELAA